MNAHQKIFKSQGLKRTQTFDDPYNMYNENEP